MAMSFALVIQNEMRDQLLAVVERSTSTIH